MRKFASLAILFSLTIGAYGEEVKLRFIKPSTVITMLASNRQKSTPFAGNLSDLVENPQVVLGRLQGSANGLVPEGVTLLAYDSKGVLNVSGPEEGIASVKRYIQLFDIEPRKVSLQLEISCPILNTEQSVSSTLVNNKIWGTNDSLLRLGINFAARINDDGTLTLFVEISRAGVKKQSFVVRLKADQTVRVSVAKTIEYALGDEKNPPRIDPSLRKQEGPSEGDIDDPEVTIDIKAHIIESVLPKAVKS